MRDAFFAGPTWAIVLTLLAGGCVSHAPPAPPAPEVSLAATAFVGPPLGPTTSPATAPSAGAVGVDVTWFAAAAMPADSLLPLDAQSTLTSSPLAGAAVLTTGRQTALARFSSGQAADDLLRRLQSRRDGAVRQIGHQTALLGRDHSVRLRCAVGEQQVLLTLARPAQPTTLPAPTTASTEPTGDGTVTIGLRGFAGEDGQAIEAMESAWLDGQDLSPGNTLALLVPCDSGGGWAVLGAYVEITDAVEVAQQATTRPATRPATTQPGVDRLGLSNVIESLPKAADPRPPLLFLAASADAPAAADAIVVATGDLLTKVRDAVASAAAAVPADRPLADVGWAAERATLLAVCEQAEKTALPPEVAAVLVVHAGEVGRHPDTLAGIVRSVGSAADLRARLVGENFIALEDPSPAARVRAFDWLKSIGRAPAGYDPLGTARERRRAINRTLDPNGDAP